MAVVVDASVLVVLASGDARRPAAQSLVRGWIADDEPMHAPALSRYEVASAFTRLVKARAMTQREAASVVSELERLPIIYHPRDDTSRIVGMALALQRQSAYDAAYLVLADDLDAELWAFDGPLARNAASIGRTVHLPGLTACSATPPASQPHDDEE